MRFSKGLEKFFRTGSLAGIQAKHATRLRIQLGMLDNARQPEDMNAPGWRLHPLKAGLKGHWTVMASGNWRLTFRFEAEDAVLVDYQDYHSREESNLRMYNPPHPGEAIREYLGEMSVAAAAEHLGVGRVTLSRVLNAKAAVSPEMAVRLARAFGTSSLEVWLGMQGQYDLWQVEKKGKIRVDLLPHMQHS